MIALTRILLIVFIGLLSAYYYFYSVPAVCLEHCGKLHRATVDHTAISPYRYRVLSALLVEPFTGDHSDRAIGIAYSVAHVIALPVMLLALYGWLRCWLTELAALSGMLVVSVFLPMMLRAWGISLYSALEVIFLCAGLVLLWRQPRGWVAAFAVIVAVSTLNRETALLLPLAYMTTQWRGAHYGRRAVLFVAAWGVVFVGLRLAFGSAPDEVTIAAAWANNTSGGWWTQEALMKYVFFLPLAVFYACQFRRQPTFLRRLAPVAAVYLALYLAFGFWHEVRLLLPLLVIILPTAMTALSPRGRREMALAHPAG